MVRLSEDCAVGDVVEVGCLLTSRSFETVAVPETARLRFWGKGLWGRFLRGRFVWKVVWGRFVGKFVGKSLWGTVGFFFFFF